MVGRAFSQWTINNRWPGMGTGGWLSPGADREAYDSAGRKEKDLVSEKMTKTVVEWSMITTIMIYYGGVDNLLVMVGSDSCGCGEDTGN